MIIMQRGKSLVEQFVAQSFELGRRASTPPFGHWPNLTMPSHFFFLEKIYHLTETTLSNNQIPNNQLQLDIGQI